MNEHIDDTDGFNSARPERDCATLDLKQIELILRIEMLTALQRAMPQIGAIVRKAYEIPD